jgi:RNA polymerase sigma factor (sigma-70 family)
MREKPGQELDNAAVTLLYHRHAPVIFGYLCLHTPSREDAEDILLDVFLGALQNENFLTSGEEQQVAWLHRVAHHKLVDRYRQSTRRQFVSIEQMTDMLFDHEDSEPEQVALRREAYTQLLGMLKQLPLLQQQVLRLRFANGLRCTEIAAILGKREGTIRSSLSRALNLLRRIYKEQEGAARHHEISR